jgi:lia operon protein LiaF
VRTRSIVGPVVLIVIGVLFLLSNLGWIPHIGQLLRTWWPLILIIVGVCMLAERAWWPRPNERMDRGAGDNEK